MTLSTCQLRGFHSFRPDADDAWQCADCKMMADRDPALPCPLTSEFLGGRHSWTGHDQRGLLCQADATWNTAKRVFCGCGASKTFEEAE